MLNFIPRYYSTGHIQRPTFHSRIGDVDSQAKARKRHRRTARRRDPPRPPPLLSHPLSHPLYHTKLRPSRLREQEFPQRIQEETIIKHITATTPPTTISNSKDRRKRRRKRRREQQTLGFSAVARALGGSAGATGSARGNDERCGRTIDGQPRRERGLGLLNPMST